ncbi:hypothetical protein [Acholeplasma laidlawii]|jgi:hypothetical protein|uniref:Uncharacterized protein n=2 Tax=Acholeplasma laidlawii TaxID=2148 RepID=A0A553IIV9_ACHLA|nr:hypothetical protein [Acholeplasma laidlawii]ABX81025.1 putative membrane-anchored protein [Acholeplasma laidlawii PG-8A]NWH11793.1 hypothetical protein [Acholeplasma laidlawii]NWH12799.1 hypothetical protein [Acholeplasma laidlawii]NWH14387.1 hypothetical protein [Acholeplasma laidlawii]OAN20618.1 hypothetical protein A2I99_00925 [Acholeplasma laidlawii]
MKQEFTPKELQKMEQQRRKKRNVKDFINKDYIDEKGDAIVDVVINDRSQLFSPYSNKMLLKNEIFTYLDTIADPIPNIYPLVINFIVTDLSTINQEYVKEALKRYYWFSYKAMESKLKRDFIFIFVYFILGLLLIIGFNLINFNELGINSTWQSVIESVITIFVWVIVWEAISQLIIGRKEKKDEMLNEKQMALAEIKFYESLSDADTKVN